MIKCVWNLTWGQLHFSLNLLSVNIIPSGVKITCKLDFSHLRRILECCWLLRTAVRAPPGSGHGDSAEWVQGKTHFRQPQRPNGLSKGRGHAGNTHWWWGGPWGGGTAPCQEATESQDCLPEAFPVLGVEGWEHQPHCCCDDISVAGPCRNWSTIRKTCLQGTAATVDALEISDSANQEGWGHAGCCQLLHGR